MPGGESFAWGFWYDSVDEETAQGEANAMVALAGFRNLISAAASIASGGTIARMLHIYQYVDGQAGGAASDVGTAAIAAGAGIAGETCPNNVALCMSLRGSVPGPPIRNRFYLPATGISGLDGGRIGQTVQQTLLGGLASLAGDRLLLANSTTRGRANTVDSISVGDVPDSQNGRRAGLVEQYASMSGPFN
uniref:Uncharacterized protein n=1 Tax=uncultured prokaryote TaxID=198431 RepID=A0A0H5Q429_9ZZZZ|nr:hypothetical protein [uncultured prokaryote]